jgi:hypothetical protein
MRRREFITLIGGAMVINLKTAQALGLTIAESFLIRPTR